MDVRWDCYLDSRLDPSWAFHSVETKAIHLAGMMVNCSEIQMVHHSDLSLDFRKVSYSVSSSAYRWAVPKVNHSAYRWAYDHLVENLDYCLENRYLVLRRVTSMA